MNVPITYYVHYLLFFFVCLSVCEFPVVVEHYCKRSFLSLLCGNLLVSLLSGTWKMRAGCILKTDSRGSQEVDRNWERGTTDVTNMAYYNTLLAVFWAFSLGWKEKCVGLSGGALAIDIAHFKAKGMVFCELPPLQGWFVPLHSSAAHFSLSHPPPPCATRPHDPPCCFLAFILPSPQSVILSAPMPQLEFGCCVHAEVMPQTHTGGGRGSD